MTDLNSGSPNAAAQHGGARQSASRPTRENGGTSPVAADADPIKLIELLFFAYRDFTGDADTVLAELGFGRAHHRVLHFVWRNPGLRVADLLDILKITKQSLARVLRLLVDEGYVEQAAGADDRRERRLHATQRGGELMQRLIALQSDRIGKAVLEAGSGAEAAAQRFLFAMIGEKDRGGVARLIGGDSQFADVPAEGMKE